MSVSLKIKFKSRSIEDFIDRYGVDVSKGGIFIRTTKPLAVGTSLTFEFQLQDGGPLLSGRGTVAWVRDKDGADTAAPGMGIRFDDLPEQNATILQRIINEKPAPSPEANTREKRSADKAPLPALQSDPGSGKIEDGEAEESHDVFGEGPASATEIALPSPELLLKSRPAPGRSEHRDADLGPNPEFGDESRDGAHEIEHDEKTRVDAGGPDTHEVQIDNILSEMPTTSATANQAAGDTAESSRASQADSDEDARQRRLEKILFSDAKPDVEPEVDPADMQTGSQPILNTTAPKDRPRRPTSAVKTVPRASQQSGNGLLIGVVVVMLASVGAWYFFGNKKVPETTPPPESGTPTMHSGKTPATKAVTPPVQVVADATPVVADATPVVADAAPVVADAAPVVADATPVVADAAPAKAALVSLTITSKPAGAQIALDGRPLNQVTPYTVPDLNPETSVEVTLELSGKKIVRVSTKPDGKTPLKVSLRKACKRIARFTSTPAGARVSLNGKRLGTTPLDYTRTINGRRSNKLRYALDGYEVFDKTLKGEQAWKRQGEDEVWVIDATLQKRAEKAPVTVSTPAKAAAKPEATKPTVTKKRPRRAKRPAKPPTEAKTAAPAKPKVDKPKVDKPKADKPKADTPKAPAKKTGIKLPSWGQ